MNLSEYFNKIQKLKSEVWLLEKEVSQLNKAMVTEYAPVEIGSVIENNQVRIKVMEVTFNGEFWTAHGPALTKNNKLSIKHTGTHSIDILNLEGPRNTVKVISN